MSTNLLLGVHYLVLYVRVTSVRCDPWLENSCCRLCNLYAWQVPGRPQETKLGTNWGFLGALGRLN